MCYSKLQLFNDIKRYNYMLKICIKYVEIVKDLCYFFIRGNGG